MKVAALDLGTNTFLCLIAEGDQNGILRLIVDQTETVRLGQGVDQSGSFHPDALMRAKDCLTRYCDLIKANKPDRILAVATSAARDVKNGNELMKIASDLHLPLKIISGDDEARLSYMGACSEVQDRKHRLVVDIGGGSTELILGRGRELLFSRSLDVGGVRLTERYVSHQPVPEKDQKSLQQTVQIEIDRVIADITRHGVEEVLAVAGTPAALAAVELGVFDAGKVDGFVMSLSQLKNWCRVFGETTVEEKKEKYKLGGRADIIFAGASILVKVLEAVGRHEFRVSVKGLRYGVALELLSGGFVESVGAGQGRK